MRAGRGNRARWLRSGEPGRSELLYTACVGVEEEEVVEPASRGDEGTGGAAGSGRRGQGEGGDWWAVAAAAPPGKEEF